jgi:hypothetical protein
MMCQCYINELCYANLISTPLKKKSRRKEKNHGKVICESKSFSKCPRLKKLTINELLIIPLDSKRGIKKVLRKRSGLELFSTKKPHSRKTSLI